MTISPSNVLILYREDSEESLEFAEYYANFRGLDASQIISLPCSGDEILSSYEEFQDQIENPLLSVLSDEYISAIVPWIIIVGYGIPGGFHQDGSIISTQSRLSRIYHEPSWGMLNPLFNRKEFKRFDEDDAEIVLIVSRFDAPSLEIAKQMVDNVAFVKKKGLANGRLLFDKFAIIDEDDEYGLNQDSDYYQDLVDFEENIIPILGLKTYKTTFWTDDVDVVIPKALNDSFMWSWKADRGGYTFFKDSTKTRFFLYNADFDGAASMRDENDKRWPLISLTSGYAASAGAMSDPLPEGYLRPRPFFETLFKGATIGEAFLVSCPNLDWTIGLFGDPLITCRFPSVFTNRLKYATAQGFDLMNRQLQDAVAYKKYAETLLIDLYEEVVTSGDIDFVIDTLPSIIRLRNAYFQNPAIFAPTLSSLIKLTSSISLADFLDRNNLKISQSLLNVDPSKSVPASLIFDPLSWYFETTIQRISNTYNIFNFEIEVSLDDSFTDILYSISSLDSVSGWTYEKEIGEFTTIPLIGVTSGFAGRHIRYTATEDQYFEQQQLYYVRYRQINEFSDATEWTVFKQVIGT